jgi:macrolide transport system ATP-binding/permease protein
MNIRTDFRYAVRLLTRTPAFTIPAIASLALGIAVTTTMFSVVNAVLLRPLGMPESGDLVRIGRSPRGEQSFRSASYDEFTYLRTHATSLDALVGGQMESLMLNGPDGSRLVSGEIVAGDYFALVAAPPAIGRSFGDAQYSGGAGDAVVVISNRFWRRQFGADPSAVGRIISLNGVAFTIVGVAPPGFVGTFPGVDIDVWLPISMIHVANPGDARRSAPSIGLLGRLKRGASIETTRAELDVLANRLSQEVPGRDRNRVFTVARARGVHPAFARVLGVFLALMLAVVGLVLLIACANVAALLLARANARHGEFAVRLALGASRPRIVRQLLVESCLLALVAAAAGVLLTTWPLQLLNAFSLISGPTGTGIFFDLRLDRHVLAFTAGVTALTVMGFGLAPAIHATRVDLIASLKNSQSLSARTRSRFRGALMVVQVALSCMLLVAAALLVRSLRNTQHIDLGFKPDGVVVASFDLRRLGYERSRVNAFYVDALRRMRALPGVQAAALANFIPMSDSGGHFTVPGMAPPPGQEAFTIPFGIASDGYFSTIQQPLARGRDFTPEDRIGAPPVAIVNQAMARLFWPGQDPIGKRVRLKREEETEFEVIGVIGDAKYWSYNEDIGPLVIVPHAQHHEGALVLYVRTVASPASALADIRRVVADLDPNVAHMGRTMRESMAFALAPARVAQMVFGVAGAVALLLAVGGLYAFVCYALEQRLKEIGIRVALGASRRRVLQVVMGSAFRLTVVGVLIGLALAAGVARLASSLLYGLSPTDPLTFGGIAVLLMAIALAAGYAAARKGLNVDPMVVLRHE